MTRRSSTRIGAVALFAALAGAACGDGGGQPTSGELLVSYYQGGPEPGAMLLTITGGPVQNVIATGSQHVSFASPYTETTKVVVVGSFSPGNLLRLTVPDVSLSASYVVRVEQVADKQTFALIDPADYTFTVSGNR